MGKLVKGWFKGLDYSSSNHNSYSLTVILRLTMQAIMETTMEVTQISAMEVKDNLQKRWKCGQRAEY